MMSKQQSQPQTGPPPPQAAHHELRTAENSAAFVLAKISTMKAQNPGLKLLDVGAGSGTITATFAREIPDGHVTGVDINAAILPRARAIAETAGLTNIDLQEGDVKKLPFPDESFDVTFCHQVLTHVASPWDGLHEMLRVTKTGGIVAVREGDLESELVWPELPGLLKFHKLAADFMIKAGGTATAGRQLISWALRAGVRREQIEASYSTWAYHTPSDKQVWASALRDRCRAGPFREKGLKLGLTTESDLDEMAKDWEDWIGRDDATTAMAHGEVIIQK